jgi:hypothetical protein
MAHLLLIGFILLGNAAYFISAPKAEGGSSMSTSVVTWVAALVTIGAFSYLFKENGLYRAIEHIYVGAAAGYTITIGYQNLVTKAWQPMVENGHYTVIIPVLLGLMLFGPYFGSSLNWTRRYPLSFIIGVGAGITIRSAIIEQFTKQLASTALPLNDKNIVYRGGCAGEPSATSSSP